MKHNISLLLAFNLGIVIILNPALHAEDSLALKYTSSGERDPFLKQLPKKVTTIDADMQKPIVEEEIVPPAITVAGLVAGGPIPQAIIGGQILRIGDTVQEAVITNITKEGVEISYKEKLFAFPAPSRALLPARRDNNDAE